MLTGRHQIVFVLCCTSEYIFFEKKLEGNERYIDEESNFSKFNP